MVAGVYVGDDQNLARRGGHDRHSRLLNWDCGHLAWRKSTALKSRTPAAACPTRGLLTSWVLQVSRFLEPGMDDARLRICGRAPEAAPQHSAKKMGIRVCPKRSRGSPEMRGWVRDFATNPLCGCLGFCLQVRAAKKWASRLSIGLDPCKR